MNITRRSFVKAAAASGAAFALPGIATGATHAPLMRTIPSSGEAIPAVGLGTWITFNVGDDPGAARRMRRGDCRLLRRRAGA